MPRCGHNPAVNTCPDCFNALASQLFAAQQAALKEGIARGELAREVEAYHVVCSRLDTTIIQLERQLADMSTANLGWMKSVDDMQARAIEAETKLAEAQQRIAAFQDEMSGIEAAATVWESNAKWADEQHNKAEARLAEITAALEHLTHSARSYVTERQYYSREACIKDLDRLEKELLDELTRAAAALAMARP